MQLWLPPWLILLHTIPSVLEAKVVDEFIIDILIGGVPSDKHHTKCSETVRTTRKGIITFALAERKNDVQILAFS